MRSGELGAEPVLVLVLEVREVRVRSDALADGHVLDDSRLRLGGLVRVETGLLAERVVVVQELRVHRITSD